MLSPTAWITSRVRSFRRRAPRPVAAPAAVSESRVTELDALRGLAILLVIVTHSTAALYGLYFYGYPVAAFDRLLYLVIHGGWVGLDLMYVLSGFLITSILLKTKGQPGYYRNFYVRRALRIFPLFYAFLLARLLLQFTPVPWLALNPGEWVANALCAANVWQCYARVNGIPFDTGGLIVTWSLAIEGQFYLVWPVVVALASRKWLGRICVAGVLVAVACRWGLTRGGADYWFAYVLTPCRMDGVLIGAAVALAATAGTPRSVFVRRAWVGLAATVAALAAVVANGGPLVHGRAVTVLGYTCAGLVSAGVLALVSAGRPGWWFLLNSRALRAVGERGYAVYLVHVPVIMVADAVFGSAPVRAVLVPVCDAVGFSGPMYVCYFGFVVGVSMLLAWGCWVAIERPCLGLKRYFPHGSGRAGTRTPAA